MNDFDDYDDNGGISGDFYSIIGQAQISELEQFEKVRERERIAMNELHEKNKIASMTLAQIAGMKTSKEIHAELEAANTREDQRLEAEAQQRKHAEKERLHAQFPMPDLKHGNGQ